MKFASCATSSIFESLSARFSVFSECAKKNTQAIYINGYIPVLSNTFTAVFTVAALEKASLKSLRKLVNRYTVFGMIYEPFPCLLFIKYIKKYHKRHI